MERVFDEFIAKFNRVAPEGATIWAESEMFQANVSVGGFSLTVTVPFDPGVRTVKAHASGLAERLWEFVEAYNAAQKIAEIKAKRNQEDISLIPLRMKAERHGFLPYRDWIQDFVQSLRAVELSEVEAEGIIQAVRCRTRVIPPSL